MDYRRAVRPFQELFKAYWNMQTPVVSAVNGTIAGAGWMLALLADLVVAAEGARWTHVFSRRGMVPHAGDPFFLPRVLPFHRLNEAMLLSDTLTSETLASWGCVNRLVPAEEVEATALDLAQRLAAGPTRSLGISKQLYRRSLTNNMETMFYEEADATALVTQTSDRYEGVKSLMEGRPPEFTGQ
jgi:2-(1,2-epoxy-1,2-dihydrophenyl)acetyl-CoA isomerase